MRTRTKIRRQDHDVALEIQVRAKHCPSMGVYPESYYDEIVSTIRCARGDFDVITEHEVVEHIIPGDDSRYRYVP